jgi:hypothetical protein
VIIATAVTNATMRAAGVLRPTLIGLLPIMSARIPPRPGAN